MFKEFRDLRRKPETGQGLPDLLNYAFAEDDQTIIMKDGARLAAGPRRAVVHGACRLDQAPLGIRHGRNDD